MPNNDYDSDFEAAGQKYNVDPQLAKTVFHMESSGGKNTGPGIPGDPDSPIGPMQMRPSTAKMLGVDPNNVHQAIDGATRYLAQGLNATQSPEGALKYYYGGPDQSGWKEKTNAYAAKGAALYPAMALKAGGAQPDAVDADFANRWGIGTTANGNAASPAEAPISEGDFASRWGIGKAPVAASPVAAPAPVAAAPVSTADKYAGWDTPGAAPAPAQPSAYDSISHALAPAPNTTYGTVVPFAIDNATGQRRFALPTSLRDLAQGAVDLAHGPTTGTVTPQATMALATMVPGLMPSPAAGTGAAVSAATGSTEVPRSVFDRAAVARAGEIRDIATQNQMQADAPLSAAFKANPGVTTPQTIVVPPVADGSIRLYHGGSEYNGGSRSLTPSENYAQGYANKGGGFVHYVDLPETHPLVQANTDYNAVAGTNMKAPIMNFDAPQSVASNLRPMGAPAEVNPLAASTPARAPNPLSTNAATPAPAPTPASAIPNGLTPAQVAEFKSIPDELPPTNKPIKTQADAEDRADQIINHFASIGNREPISGAEGSLPTITGNSGLATLYRAVRDSDTPVPFTTLENASKAKNLDTLTAMNATTDQASIDALAAAKMARVDATKPLYDKVWANKGEADVSVPAGVVKDLMNSPAKQNDNLMPELKGIQKKLAGETDPAQLKGIADNIDSTMSKLNTDGKGDRQTLRALDQVKQSIFEAIEPAAPGFRAAQAEWAKHSRGIDEMTYLQGRKLTDLQGNPTLGNIRSTLDDISKKQRSDKFNPADSVTSENIATLRKMHDQMQREQLTQSAGKALGSNTFQNLATNSTIGNLSSHVGNSLAGGLIGGGIDLASGGGGMSGFLAGNALGATAKYYATKAAATAEVKAAAGQKMLMEALQKRLLNIDNSGVRSLNAAPKTAPNPLSAP